MQRLRARVLEVLARLGRLGPLAPALLLLGLLFALWTLSRLVLVALFWERIGAVDDWAWLIPIGWRMDSIQASYLLALPVVALLALPLAAVRRAGWLFAAYITGVVLLATWLEAASAPFIAQFDARPNRIFIDYLEYPTEVL